ncbi:hypothetical protein SAMN02745135_01121 [Caloranaerobacter azorensis DSM 13643]|uniref:Uncharacterized protein n=1 Tax=Caloranaerobacter azorensis DSM 13643 TaxID=1121264 RepID=A0A1M5TTC5_9FIRM|nr:hypothetical protein [Caloranaerobacter azorensis]SHH53928.1 hypothetical protein SAMN02745135_01121 [Caloranaerobacter azorensis DSM 13643]
MYKTVFFYKLDIKKTMQNDYYSESDFYNIFNDRLNKNDIKINTDSNWGNYYSCLINNDLVVDILTHTNEYMFATIGKTKNKNVFRRFRNLKNLTHKDLSLDPNTSLEDYTYFLLDYSFGVISVLNTKSAPSIKKFKNILSYYGSMEPHIYPIKNNNIKSKLGKVKEIGGLRLTFAIPPYEILAKQKQNPSFEILNRFRNDGFEKCDLIFYLDRKNPKRKNPKNIIKHVLDTYKLIKESNDNKYKLEKLGLIATLDEEQQQTIDIFELYFTKGVKIEIDNDFSEKNILNLLKSVYNELKGEILGNIRLHSKQGE